MEPSTENGAGGGSAGGPSEGYVLTVSAGQRDSGDSSTRAFLDTADADYTYYWSGSEQIKLTIAEEGSSGDISAVSSDVDRILLTSTTTTQVAHTNFASNLNAGEYQALQTAPTFDFYALYANGLAVTDTDFPNTITFPLGKSTYTAPTVGSFELAKTPMVAIAKDKAPNVTYASAQINNTTFAEDVNDGIHLDFDHTTSYAAIEFDVRLFASDVTVSDLTLTVGTASNADTWINGTYTYDIATQTGAITSGTNSVTFTGSLLTIGSGQKLYIPMPAKTFTGQRFLFSFTLSSPSSGNIYDGRYTTVINNTRDMTFERGKIHPILIAPKTALYTTDETFTVSRTGYYYIEAWGGDGGDGGSARFSGTPSSQNGGKGGVAQRMAGLYLLTAGKTVNVQVGRAGGNGTNGGYDDDVSYPGGAGGAARWFGAGHAGGAGGDAAEVWGIETYASGGGAGGGGGASGVLYDGTTQSNIIVASGGGGGGGGAAGRQIGGKGGESNDTGETPDEADDNYSRGGNGWSTSSTAGQLYGSGSIDGRAGSTGGFRGGGGGGGGGGGWYGAEYVAGGGAKSGTGGNRGYTWDTFGGGGGGAGGRSSAGALNVIDPASVGVTLPEQENARPTDRKDGYVVITFLKRAY
jgi:hypothetical protein